LPKLRHDQPCISTFGSQNTRYLFINAYRFRVFLQAVAAELQGDRSTTAGQLYLPCLASLIYGGHHNSTLRT